MTAAAGTAARREPRPPSPRRGRPETVVALRPALDAAAATVVGTVAGFGVPVAVGYGAATVLALAADRAYRPRITTEVGLRVPRLAVAAGLPLPALVLLTSGRTAGWVPVAAVAATAVLVTMLHAATAAAERTRRRLGGGEPALVVGAGETGLRLTKVMAEHPELGLVPCGLLDDAAATGPGGAATACRGRPADLPRLVAEQGITRVVVAFPAAGDPAAGDPADGAPTDAVDGGSEGGLADVLYAARELGARVWVVPRLAGPDVPLAHLDDLWGTPLVALRAVVAEGSLAGRVRRGIEVVLAVALLVITGPVVLAAAALAGPAGLAGRGPAFFHQWRLSRRGELVRVTKIRTIVGGEDGHWAVPHDRITPWGRLLRRTHVDELPQLLGVLRGELALIGPRPERPVFATRFDRTVPGYAGRLRVRAGLTGWAQVHGLCGDTPIDDRARFDSQYVEHRSPWLDAVILLRTLASPRLAPDGDRVRVDRSPGGPS